MALLRSIFAHGQAAHAFLIPRIQAFFHRSFIVRSLNLHICSTALHLLALANSTAFFCTSGQSQITLFHAHILCIAGAAAAESILFAEARAGDQNTELFHVDT